MTRQRALLGIAIGVLAGGILFYFLGRQHDHVYFLSKWLAPTNLSISLFGLAGQSLPTFIHVYALILLTVVIAGPAVSRVISICLSWLFLDSLFEVGQIDSVARWIAAHVPDWFSGIPFLENTARYFLFGTFDPFDLASIAAGTMAAFITTQIFKGRNKHEHYP